MGLQVSGVIGVDDITGPGSWKRCPLVWEASSMITPYPPEPTFFVGFPINPKVRFITRTYQKKSRFW